MRFYRLFMKLALIGLFIPAGTAWAGGSRHPGSTTDLLIQREDSLMRVCQNSPGEICAFSTPCSGNDQCVVKYITEPLSATLTVIADDQPVIQSGCAERTVFLRGDSPSSLFANAALVNDIFQTESLEFRITTTKFNGEPQSVTRKFLYRRVDFFTAALLPISTPIPPLQQLPPEAVPVIASITEPPIIQDNHSGKNENTDTQTFDPLASAVRFKVEIRFALPNPSFNLPPEPDNIASSDPCRITRRFTTPVPGDLDEDRDVDQNDVNVLLADRDKNISQSSCGAHCDLDADGKITARDARKLRSFCTRPRCATQ